MNITEQRIEFIADRLRAAGFDVSGMRNEQIAILVEVITKAVTDCEPN